MAAFAEVRHEEWIAAPIEQVRAQFADLDHHIQNQVHPKLRFEVQERGPHRARYLQEVRLLGIRQRDVFERRIAPDGSIVDTSVEGFNAGGSISAWFAPREQAGRAGTAVTLTVRLPLPPLVGALVRPLLERQVARELRAAAAEDKHDLEVRGYPAARRTLPAGVAPA
jgi:hypothetical protein